MGGQFYETMKEGEETFLWKLQLYALDLNAMSHAQCSVLGKNISYNISSKLSEVIIIFHIPLCLIKIFKQGS